MTRSPSSEERGGAGGPAPVVRTLSVVETPESRAGHAREHLAGYKVPRSFDVVETMPRSEAGKLVKRQLRNPYWEAAGRSI